MAEGWMRKLAPDNVTVKSAGLEAHGQNNYAIKVMAEAGIDISKQESIRVNSEMLEWADLVVTLCDNAEEQCPVIRDDTIKLHLPLLDPAKIKGTPEEIISGFREARDKVKQRIKYVAEQLVEITQSC
jgi:arsenate reductase